MLALKMFHLCPAPVKRAWVKLYLKFGFHTREVTNEALEDAMQKVKL